MKKYSKINISLVVILLCVLVLSGFRITEAFSGSADKVIENVENYYEAADNQAEETMRGLVVPYQRDFPYGLSVDGVEVINGDGDVGGKEVTTAITSTTTLTVAQSGSTFYLDPADSIMTTITLPAATDGLFYGFVVAGTFTVNAIIDSAEGDNIYGVILTGGVDYACSAEDQVNFIADGELPGDFFELRSDGTNWYIGANGATADEKITCTDPS